MNNNISGMSRFVFEARYHQLVGYLIAALIVLSVLLPLWLSEMIESREYQNKLQESQSHIVNCVENLSEAQGDETLFTIVMLQCLEPEDAVRIMLKDLSDNH